MHSNASATQSNKKIANMIHFISRSFFCQAQISSAGNHFKNVANVIHLGNFYQNAVPPVYYVPKIYYNILW